MPYFSSSLVESLLLLYKNQALSPYLFCQPCSKHCPLCLLVLSYQAPVSGQCVFPTLSTSIYPALQGYQGNMQSLWSRQTSQSHQDRLKIWIIFKSRSILQLVQELWIFHRLPSTPKHRSWTIGMSTRDLKDKTGGCGQLIAHPLELTLYNLFCVSSILHNLGLK